MVFWSRSQPEKPSDDTRAAADKKVSDQRRADAARLYRSTGDSTQMWAEKSRHVKAVTETRNYDNSPAGRREARQESRRQRFLNK